VRECEVAVFGSGPAGLAVASRLLTLGHRVLIFDCPSRQRPWGGESLTGEIRAPLTALGCWATFEQAGHTQGYERTSAWGGPPTSQTSMLQPFGPLWHVDRQRFDDDLRSAVSAQDDVFFSYRKLDSLTRSGCRWHLVLDGQAVQARYLVDATGRARAIARRLNARITAHDMLIGLTASVVRNRSASAVEAMLVAATPFGWWYAAPTPTGHVLAFFTDADLAPSDLRRTLRPVAANSVFTHTERDAGWLAVGDAYAAHDPLCGWGVHRALSNGLRAADALAAFLAGGNPLPLHAYHDHCARQFERYLTGLAGNYAIEQRWPTAPFWSRRHPLKLAA
jgi:flavin-dependent dehydrogenase